LVFIAAVIIGIILFLKYRKVDNSTEESETKDNSIVTV